MTIESGTDSPQELHAHHVPLVLLATCYLLGIKENTS